MLECSPASRSATPSLAATETACETRQPKTICVSAADGDGSCAAADSGCAAARPSSDNSPPSTPAFSSNECSAFDIMPSSGVLMILFSGPRKPAPAINAKKPREWDQRNNLRLVYRIGCRFDHCRFDHILIPALT